MIDLRDKSVLIWDNGLFVDLAVKLAEKFGRVLYGSPWVSGFPTSNALMPGEGLPGVTRIKDLYEHVDEVDLIVFPDIYFADVQDDLVKQGKRVWGGRWGEELERNRVGTKQYLKKIGLPVGGYKEIQGIDNLRAYLKDTEDKFVKVSETRGDGETWKHETYEVSEPVLDELEYKLGAKKHLMKWVIEDDISPAIEVGFDGYTIDGQYPDPTFFGFEIKDLGFVGSIKRYADLGEPVIRVNEALTPAFQRYNYRGFFSSELRITHDGEPYLIDPCCRMGSPPHEIYLELISNWPEIIWHGAEGVMIPPEPVARFGVCAMLHSGWAIDHWTPVRYPEKIEPFIKLRYWCKIDGVSYFTPQVGSHLPEVGAVVGIGDTLEEAVKHCKDNADQIVAYDIEPRLESLPKALAEIQEAEKMGITLSEDKIDPERIQKILSDEK